MCSKFRECSCGPGFVTSPQRGEIWLGPTLLVDNDVRDNDEYYHGRQWRWWKWSWQCIAVEMMMPTRWKWVCRRRRVSGGERGLPAPVPQHWGGSSVYLQVLSVNFEDDNDLNALQWWWWQKQFWWWQWRLQKWLGAPARLTDVWRSQRVHKVLICVNMMINHYDHNDHNYHHNHNNHQWPS